MNPLAHILCPLDFDEHSGRALARAQDLARRNGAHLTLLHVLPLRAESLLMPLPGTAERRDAEARAHLGELASLIGEAGVRCDVAIVHGDPALQILLAARERKADLIVMATHGRKGVPRVVLGSVTEAVLHATPCPLLTIPPRAAGAGGSFRRVLCAVDFSPSSAATFTHALAMLQEAHGEVTLLNVIDPAYSAGEPAGTRDRVERALAGLHGRLPEEMGHWCVIRDTVRLGETAAEILKQARDDEADLIVIGAHSRRPAMAPMVGSCADRVTRESSCPVLAVPAPVPAVPLPALQPLYA
jgi:nucleotide-binding universal stress UspA family protein